MTAFRASSLAAVTIFVWSTRLNLSSAIRARTACRMRTMSSSVARGFTSLWMTGMDRLRAEHGHAHVDVQRRANAGKRQSELDERDRHGRAHADDDGVRIENARHRRDVGEHAADERVDHLERGDVD